MGVESLTRASGDLATSQGGAPSVAAALAAPSVAAALAAGSRPTLPARHPPRVAHAAVLFVTAAAAWLTWVGTTTLSDEHNLWHAVTTQRATIVGPALLGAVAAIFVAEQLWPAVRRPVLARAHLVDAGYLALFAVLVAPLVIVIDTGFAVEAQRHAPFLILGRLAVVPQILVVAVILVGMDAMNWFAHAASHRFGGLWRIHAMHHSQEDMSVFTTFRTHPLVHAVYLPAVLPALILGASGPVPSDALVAYGCFVALAHANLSWTFGPLRRILVSPAYHRLHHAATPVDARGALNFGFVLAYWDRLARRAIIPVGESPVVTGIAGRPVPIEQTVGALRVPGVILAQLVQPFGPRATTDGAP